MKPSTPAELLAHLDASRVPRPSLDVPFRPPAAGWETSLAAFYAEVLGLAEVGSDDNFFSLGGDSVHMTMVASRCRERCGVEIPLEDFFDNPTVGELARLVRLRHGDGQP